jgi:hypothetical protein
MDQARGPRKSGRRAVLDGARRKVERALFVAGAADELAGAAQLVLSEAEVEQVDLERPDMAALRAALDRYLKARDA